jgi:peroxiredoxin
MRRRDAARLFTRFVIAIPLLAGAGIIVWLTMFARRTDERMAERFKLKPGGGMPYVQLQDRAGAATSLAQVAGSGPALVVLTDADCQFCDNEIRTLSTFKMPGAPRVVAVSVSKPGGFATLAKRHPQLTLYDDVNGAFRGKLGLEGVPVTLALGADGTVRDVKFGLQNGSQLQALMQAATAPAVGAVAER